VTAAPEREIGRELTGALHDSTGSYELVIAAVGAAGFGFLIDRAFGIVPVFTLVFAIAGFIGAGYSLWLTYRAQMAEATAERLDRVAGPVPEVDA
jgi:F0F1-type ATP synthase assembly protein I